MTTNAVVTLTHYAGRAGGTGLADLATGPEIRIAVERADGVVIADPLSFPWDFFVENPPLCPVVIDLTECTPTDIVALAPALQCLTESDGILGDPVLVATTCQQLGLDDLWIPTDTDLTTFVATSAWSKRADIEERAIMRRLAEDPTLEIVVVDGETIRDATSGFADRAIGLSEQFGGAVLDTIWGIHPYPGQPVDRVILAFRPVVDS